MSEYAGIYCIENVLNGKPYVGQGANVRVRMRAEHPCCAILNNAISKYGENNFKRYVLVYCETWELERLERAFIKTLGSHFSEGGYNISWGGRSPMLGLKASDETKKKMSESRQGSRHPLFGKHHSQETKRKMSESHIGVLKGRCSDETKLKMSLSHKGKSISEAQKLKLSDSLKGKPWSKARKEAQERRKISGTVLVL